MAVCYALIGCGNWGMSHLEWLMSSEKIDLKWVADTREEALEAVRLGR